MIYYSGYYYFSLLRYNILGPKHFSLSLPDARIEFKSRERAFEFRLKSNVDDENLCRNIIMAGEQGLGILLDIPLGASWSISSEPNTTEFPLDDDSEASIYFDLMHQTIDKETFKDIVVPKQITIVRSELEELTSCILRYDSLASSIYYYLKAIDEPDQYLALLYKAYEIIRYTKVIPKKQANRFRKLANDPEVIYSRHVGPSSKMHGIPPEDVDFCYQTIRNGILKFAESLR